MLGKEPKKALAAERLLTAAEQHDLADALAAAMAPADLLGRARVREMVEKREGNAFSEGTPARAARFAAFADPVPEAPTPEAALAYFRRLVPSLDRDPRRYGADLRRAAFTAAEATDETLLDHLQEIIAGWIETGEPTRGADAIAEALDRAGVSPANPQYSEMVFRTNVADAYQVGAWDEFSDPDVAEEFPGWEYFNPADARSRPHHAEKSGNVYPNSVTFNEVRGTEPGDVCNCRCSFLPLHKSQYQAAERAGRLAPARQVAERFSEVDVFCKTGPNAGKPGPCPKEKTGAKGAAKKKAKPAAPPKPTADTVHADVKALLESGKRLDRRHVAKVAAQLQTLTVAQMKDVKQRLGLRGSGAKAAQAKLLAERAVAAVKAKVAAAKAGAPKPAAPKKPGAAAGPAPRNRRRPWLPPWRLAAGTRRRGRRWRAARLRPFRPTPARRRGIWRRPRSGRPRRRDIQSITSRRA